MKKILFIFIYILVSTVVFSQSIEDNPQIRTSLNQMFSGLNKSKVPYGLLRDYAFELADLDIYNGKELNDSNYSDRIAYENVLRTIRSSHLNPPPFKVEEILRSQIVLGNEKECKIGIALYQYSQIKQNALDNNLIKYENGIVSDNFISGTWQNPYETGYSFVFSPQDSIFSGELTFTFPDNIWMSNVTLSRMEFDADDGKGYRTINKGASFTTSFPSKTCHLRLRATLANGVVLHSHSLIKVYANVKTRASIISYMPDRFSVITGSPHNGISAQGSISILYSKNGNRTLTRPFIIIEGFDPIEFASNKTNIIGLDRRCANTNIVEFLSQIENNSNTFYNNLRDNYDIVYIDMFDSKESVQANAKLFEAVINNINAQKTSTEKNIILARSMGGLVARYTLKTMENTNLKHETSLIIYHDTPFIGANVPLGALFGIYGISNILSSYFILPIIIDGTFISNAKSVIHSTAVKQMLYNYVNTSGVIDNSVHNTFVSELAQLGYPQGDSDYRMKSASISNGSRNTIPVNEPYAYVSGKASLSLFVDAMIWATGLGNTITTTLGSIIGTTTIDWKNFVLGILPGNNKIKGSVEINPTGNGKPLCKISLTYIKKFLWTINISHTFYNYTKNMPNGIIPFDIMPGSYYDVPEMAPEDKSNTFYQYGIDIKTIKNIMFVPTVSALDIGAGKVSLAESDYRKEYSMNFMPTSPKHAPFDSYYIETESSHISTNRNILNWIYEQMRMDINGPDIAQTGTQYIIQNNTQNYPITWESSDINIATINSNGVLTMKKHGYITLTATYVKNSMITRFQKEVMVGLPSYVIEYFLMNGVYTFTLKPLKYITDKYKSLIKYQKAIRNSKGNLEWIDCVNDRYTVNAVSNGTQTIYLRAISNSGVISETLFETVNIALPYILSSPYFSCHRNTNVIKSVNLIKNPNYKSEIPYSMMIDGIQSRGSTDVLINTPVTQVTLNAENIFTTTVIQNCKNQGITSTATFSLRGTNGKVLQTFSISIIRE